MPPYIPFHQFLIYATGVYEVFVGLSLVILPSARRQIAISLALYFIAILPAHFHVAINAIPMFGIKSPVLLWFRTGFQAVFIFWAWNLKDYSESAG